MFRQIYISLFILAIALLMQSSGTVHGGSFHAGPACHSASKENPFENFFDIEEPLHLSLKFDIKTFQRTASKEAYHPAELSYFYNDSTSEIFRVKLKTRGIFRKSYCTVPPFWMNIYESGIGSEDLDEIKKMKVVTHCMNKDEYQDYLLKEYLVYKMYSLITPYSFRVRLLRLTYIDTGRKNRVTESWAFAIEPKELMAKRLDATLVEDEQLSMRNMNSALMDRLALFNYMIGNTDYSIPGLHNIKLIRLNNPGPVGVIPVPYDFDFTGFVNTVYAKPANNTRISEVTSRFYTGLCRSDYMFEKLVDDFKVYSDDIHRLLQPFEYLSLKQKLDMMGYIETFFNELARDDFIEWKLRTSCRE